MKKIASTFDRLGPPLAVWPVVIKGLREERVFELIAMRVDPRFDPLRTDSRFDTIVEQIGFD